MLQICQSGDLGSITIWLKSWEATESGEAMEQGLMGRGFLGGQSKCLKLDLSNVAQLSQYAKSQ